MKLNYILLMVLILVLSGGVCAQRESEIDQRIFDTQYSNYKQLETYFNEAYNQYSNVPRGAIEAVSFVNTRFYNVLASSDTSCTGMPQYLGVMGFIFNGKGYFKENGNLIASINKADEEEMMKSARNQVVYWACAFDSLSRRLNIAGSDIKLYLPVFVELSEIPWVEGDQTNAFAIGSHLYSVIDFLNSSIWQQVCGFPNYQIAFDDVFPETTLRVLQSQKVNMLPDGTVRNNDGVEMNAGVFKSALSTDYAPAIWDPTTCNYSSRSGTPISAYVLHTVQGSYAGCISWFKNCTAQASTHYVMRSSDGQVTQMVLEADKAWHVRDENPYTIGTEMEGYVDNPAWYTQAVYTSHSDLVRDVCNSGYGINPLRMFYRDTLDNGTALDYGVHVLAGSTYCVKIAGHQHYPNNTHTDPGPNWSWDYFFRLVNNNPTATTYTTPSGSFFDTGGASGSYANDERKVWTIAPPGAGSVTLTFSAFDVEDNYDFLYIYDGPDVFSPRIGRYNTLSPGTVTANSGVMTIEFRSDCATVGSGWSATWSSTTQDIIAPTTVVSSIGNWKTDDFSATYTDIDNTGGSGVQKGYYQVLENQGTEWRANASKGFFADNFDVAIHPDWTTSTGTWSVNSQTLYQSDTIETNTNIYIAVDQTLSNRTLYQFKVMVPGSTKVNKRFGLHFFCDDASQTNRGNGYFIFFRLESDQLEFYKVTNNAFTLENTFTGVVTNLNQWYDYKIIYDRITGKTWVYRDDILLGSYIYASPYNNNGNYVSFRTGNARVNFDELKIYRSRAASNTITVGGLSSDDIRYQNPSPSVYGAKIKSICQDSAENISPIYYYDLNIDFTPPSDVAWVNDGASTDEDIWYSSSSLYANWASSADTNSNISHYLIAIGTTSGGNEVTGWVNNGAGLSANINGLSLSQGSTYYISIKAVNNAGLESNAVSSDGVVVATSTLAGFALSAQQICEGDSIHYTNTSVGATSCLWEFDGGIPATSTLMNPTIYYPLAGVYGVILHAYGGDTADLSIPALVNVRARAIADFEVNDTILYIPDAMALFTNNSQNAISYDWDFGDGALSSDVNPWHLYGDTGWYSVQLVSASQYCGTDTLNKQFLIHVMFPESINELNYDGTFLYPNPASDYVDIVRDANKSDIATVKIINSEGRLVFITNIAEGQSHLRISTSEFASGLYQVIIQGEFQQTMPLFIQ
ncbi:MAG: hypothetical protein CVU11_05525 [Bacteroidetes bacterium HGW-Bacteroidetes-6]|jgi:N-acetyl-anhydromuramyl-L-alanine amidase AmpD|nr:MAG: hypothetical protein CVU11_05525 [Bacteroidetes bacterium HGW-Bacteroidetes-6]